MQSRRIPYTRYAVFLTVLLVAMVAIPSAVRGSEPLAAPPSVSVPLVLSPRVEYLLRADFTGVDQEYSDGQLLDTLAEGVEEGVNGASPIPGTVNSMNCPVSNCITVSGFNLMVFIVGVSFITSSTSERVGLYGLSL